MKKVALYGFDVNYEYRTYKHIGVNYEIKLNANKHVRYKLKKKIRKILNAGGKRYRDFDTYSEWREYIEDTYQGHNKINYDNFRHYLLAKERAAENIYVSFGSIITPIYVLELSVVLCFGQVLSSDDSKILYYFFIYLITFGVFIFLLLKNYNAKQKFHFYEDILTIIEK